MIIAQCLVKPQGHDLEAIQQQSNIECPLGDFLALPSQARAVGGYPLKIPLPNQVIQVPQSSLRMRSGR